QAPAQQAAAIDPAGEQLYKSICFACHATGVANAPKLGDKAAWAPLIAEGLDSMVTIAINGKGAMPPRGGSQASDAEIKAAVEYMLQSVQ
ncbi:MAG: c-type cytochrome, partial [Pusillimonas sp.]